MPNAAGYLKRGQPALYPHEITVIEDEKPPLYDPRIENPVTDDFIRNLVIVGQIVPVAVRIEDDDALLVDGRSRWKAGTVINHLTGTETYRGKLACVREAIARNKGGELEALIVDRCAPLGIKLAFTVRRGTMDDAVTGMVSANEQRTDDDKAAKICRAQRLAGHNHKPEEIATVMGQPLATVKRWLKVDLSAPPAERKARGTATRPSAKILTDLATALRAADHDHDAAVLLDFAAGKITLDEAIKEWPGLADAVTAKKAKAA